jgi:hypothetical protein
MGLVDDRLIQRAALWLVISPIEGLVHDDRARHERSAIAIVSQIWTSDSIRKDHIGLLNNSIDCLAVGIEKELVRIVKETIIRCPRPMDTESVSMSRVYTGNVAVMDETVHLRESEPGFVSEVIKET